MAKPTASYFFGRLNLRTVERDKRKFISASLQKRVELPVKSHRIGFFDVEDVTHLDNDFAFGKLVKFRPELTTEIADRTTHRLEDAVLHDFIVAKAPFALHYRTGLIAFRTAY